MIKYIDKDELYPFYIIRDSDHMNEECDFTQDEIDRIVAANEEFYATQDLIIERMAEAGR